MYFGHMSILISIFSPEKGHFEKKVLKPFTTIISLNKLYEKFSGSEALIFLHFRRGPKMHALL